MNVRKVCCPSCGASIELPAELTRGHCVYCGSQVVVDAEPRRVKIDRDDELNKSCQLLKTAMDVWNVGDVLRYADKVLDIDPANSYAWHCKGVATCYLSSMQDDRFEEAKTYLDKALEMDPKNSDAAVARERWPLFYAQYLSELAQQHWNLALQAHTDGFMPPPFKSYGQQQAAPYAAAAHATVDKALFLLWDVPPGDARDQWESALLTRKIRFLDPRVTGGRFGTPDACVRRLDDLKAKSAIRLDVTALPRLLDELGAIEAEIARIEQGGGFLDRRRLDDLRKQRDRYTERITRAEELRDAEGTPPGEGVT